MTNTMKTVMETAARASKNSRNRHITLPIRGPVGPGDSLT